MWSCCVQTPDVWSEGLREVIQIRRSGIVRVCEWGMCGRPVSWHGTCIQVIGCGLIVCVCVCVCVCVSAVCVQTFSFAIACVQVRLEGIGEVIGRSMMFQPNHYVNWFLGVPYSRPPTYERRFKVRTHGGSKNVPTEVQWAFPRRFKVRTHCSSSCVPTQVQGTYPHRSRCVPTQMKVLTHRGARCVPTAILVRANRGSSVYRAKVRTHRFVSVHTLDDQGACLRIEIEQHTT